MITSRTDELRVCLSRVKLVRLMMTLVINLQSLTLRVVTSVGSHTMTHPNLAHVDEIEAQWEIFESKRRLSRC